jgi:hypothetical protein
MKGQVCLKSFIHLLMTTDQPTTRQTSKQPPPPGMGSTRRPPFLFPSLSPSLGIQFQTKPKRNETPTPQVTGMQSGLGLLTYQGQTGAVGHGEYFFFHFGSFFSFCWMVRVG